MAKTRDFLLALVFCLCLLVCYVVPPVQAANVLAVLPSVWKSHYLFGRRLLQQLVAQPQHNHSVTLISPHAEEVSVARIREIRIEGLLENWLEMGLSFDVEHMRQKSIMERFTRLIYAGTTNVDLILADTQVRKLLLSGEHFDLLIVDLFLSDSLLGLAQYYGVPSVVLSPAGSNTWLNQMVGNPQSSALDPSGFLPYIQRMNVWQRSVNTLMGLFEKLTYNFFHMIAQQTIYEKHFRWLCLQSGTNDTLPHHRDLTKNLSLVLLNSHSVVQYPRAYLPNMLEVAGVHLQSAEQRQLPNSLRVFIESATHGVAYLSLGADLRTIDMTHEKVDAFLDAFSYLQDMHFLLKWEQAENRDVQFPANVLVSDWFPQEAILAHPNVKVFISTCGLLSVVEAINGRTPVLAIPIQPEQEVAAERLQSQGVAVTISFDAIAYDAIILGVQELIQNVSYQENMQQLYSQLNADYGTPAEKAIHFIELIMTTGGANFLKSHAAHLNFVRTELIDVLAIIFLGAFIILAVPFFVICYILKSYYRSSQIANNYHVSLKLRESTRDSDLSRHQRRNSHSVSSTSSASSSASPNTPPITPQSVSDRRARATYGRQTSQQSN